MLARAMTSALALRHVPFESLGLLEPLLRERGLEVECIDVPTTPLDVARLVQTELLVVLGGPVGAYEDHLYPFLRVELAVLEARLRTSRPILGICLGAQLLARALGARVYPGQKKELGWSPLILTPEARLHPISELGSSSVLHWHGDTFDLPQGTTWLASTEVTPHQAFAFSEFALGLQFHLEVTEPSLEAWYVGHAAELASLGEGTIPRLRREAADHAASLVEPARRAFSGVLDQMLNRTPAAG